VGLATSDRIEVRELMTMRLSPEKGGGAKADTGFMEEKMEPRSPQDMFYPWRRDGADY
jgi:hypothetical protein